MPAHSNGFTALRLLAAILVLVGHGYAVLGHGSEPLAGLVGVITLGGLGVDALFAVSAFLVAGSLFRRPGAAAFLRRRALRLLPGLAVAVLLGVVVLGPAVTVRADYWRDPATPAYLLNALVYPWRPTLPGVFEGNPVSVVNGSLWTLAHGASCWLMLLLVAWSGALHPRGLAALLGVALALHLGGAFHPDTRWMGMEVHHLDRFAVLFLGGALLAALHRRAALRWGAVAPVAGALVALALVLAQRDARLFAPLYLLAWPALVIAAAMLMPRAARLDRHDLSYGVYLYAFPVQQLLAQGMGRDASPVLLNAAALPLVLALAALSWRWVERPALLLRGSSDGARSGPARGAPAAPRRPPASMPVPGRT